MAIAQYDTSNSAKFASVSGTQSVSLTIGTEAMRFLVLDVMRYDGTLATLSAPVWDTDAMTDPTWSNGTSPINLRTFYLVNPKSGTFNASVTLSDAEQGICLAATAYYGVDPSAPVGTRRTNTGTTETRGWIGVDGTSNDLTHSAIVWDQGAAARTLTSINGIPKWVSTATMTVASAATSHTCTNAPAGRQLGDIEIASIRTESGGAKTFTWSGTGWSKLGTEKAQSTNCTMGWAIRTYDGTNADPSASWSGASDVSMTRHLIRDGKMSGTAMALHGTVGTGTASPCTATGANTTATDVLVAISTGSGVNNAFGADSVSSYTEHYDAGSATGPARQAFDSKEFATSGTASGNTSKTNTSPVSWVSQPIEIYQATNGDQTQRVNQSDVGSIASACVSTERGDTYNSHGWTMSVAGAAWAMGAFAVQGKTELPQPALVTPIYAGVRL